MPTAAAYIRVSTEDQMEFSPDSQLRSIQAYALNHHIELLPAHIYLDATDIIGLKQNPTNGRRFSPIFLCIGHFSE